MRNLINAIGKLDVSEANKAIKGICGVVNFFSSIKEKDDFILSYTDMPNCVCEDKVSYGDWQTPETLAYKICKKHINTYGSPDIVIEPTCGLGAFVISSLKLFPNLKEIHALEINPIYTQALKFRILTDALAQPKQNHPDIYIYTANFFEFKFSDIFDKIAKNNWRLALIGNPPWVTNSRQGMNDSSNTPVKINRFGLRGIDAITGKSNFDISEYITLSLLESVNDIEGGVSFLLKNSVIRNIIIKQKSNPLNIGNLKQESIDAAKEFNVSVDASCFSAKLGCVPCFTCERKDFYSDCHSLTYGWCGNSFVSNLDSYETYSRFDGASTFVWRSGIKHDCSNILEVRKLGDQYVNGIGESISIEQDLLYPLMKSSDVNKEDWTVNKFIIIPQRSVGGDTSYLKHTYPLAYQYLESHEESFKNRKSSIYKNKDRFSIFGIGDYTFKPYKIVVSSLYKRVHFRLLKPINNKPVILDDTCYQLGFDEIEEAEAVLNALQSIEIQNLLESLIFYDAKRVVTKSLLMRLDIEQYFREKGIKLNTEPRNTYKQLNLFDQIG